MFWWSKGLNPLKRFLSIYVYYVFVRKGLLIELVCCVVLLKFVYPCIGEVRAQLVHLMIVILHAVWHRCLFNCSTISVRVK